MVGALVATALVFVPPSEDSRAQLQQTNDTYDQLKLFADVFERVRSEYVEEVTDQDLMEAAITGMLTNLDPHSSFLNSKSFRDMRVQTKGEFGGRQY